MKAYFQKRIFDFIRPAGTSRGVLTKKPSWFIFFYDEATPDIKGIGEVSIIPGLSIDNDELIEDKLTEICADINTESYKTPTYCSDFPAITFGLEMALLDYKAKGSKVLFESEFTKGDRGIATNGLIWMGAKSDMLKQVEQKVEAGFRCLKMKIGAVDLREEFSILESLRKRFAPDELELRVDANGAFSVDEAVEVLKRLADLQVHSIEQPIRQNRIDEMAGLCQSTPVPIALDEELIGIVTTEKKLKLLDTIQPQYLILKPSLLGGFAQCEEWIRLAEQKQIGWWATSALESNIGLNAIAQWVAAKDLNMYQGLGLGNLYKQNIPSPLELNGEKLFYKANGNWCYDFVY